MKPPSRFGENGGREELGATEPDRDVQMKDRGLSLSAHFSSLLNVCVK